MKVDQLKDEILFLNSDLVFTYAGVNYCIIPFNANKFQLCLDDNVKEYHTIDDLFSDPVFSGKTLADIAEQINLE